jgi:hypothetical protein
MLQNKEGHWITSDTWSFTSKASKEGEFAKKSIKRKQEYQKGNKNFQI